MKQPNHLASQVDKQHLSVQHLPQNMFYQYQWLTKLTKQVQEILASHLPACLLQTLIVGGYANGKLTLAVDNQTAVNHLRYQCQHLQSILKQTVTFCDLEYIHIVLYAAQPTFTKNNPPTERDVSIHQQSTDNQNTASSQDKHTLSDEVRENISHTAQTVIKDERLKKALIRLATT